MSWGTANHDAITLFQRVKEPEEYLWIAVLTRAVQDVFVTSDWQATQSAIAWFKGRSRDFKLVCEFAGRNPQYVYSKIISKINNREEYIDALKQRRPYARGSSPLIKRNKTGKRGRTRGTKIPKWDLPRKITLNGKKYYADNVSSL